ncbi:SUMF1/EgtB/PvdO family nonheme iron enzyme, partial [candidate division KSB1 bacterium]|nr:SUMF1/EgtB/PvdO family nonheme iron enzyme [candidate division KSB1 bacterium]
WAAGGGKHLYPWGKQEPDKTHANFGQEVGHTTPVGSYPEGATPDGLMDMAGNVWEWMENLYGQKDFRDARALRGGSWNYEADYLPCSARSRNYPVSNWFNDGFRVVCVQS